MALFVEMLPEVVTAHILPLLTCVELAHLLACHPRFWRARRTYWISYWQMQRNHACRECGAQRMEPLSVIVVAFDHASSSSCKKPCLFPHPDFSKKWRQVWLFCGLDCFEVHNLANTANMHEGHLLEPDKRSAEFRCNDGWERCRCAIAVPAWPIRHHWERRDYDW